MMTPTTTIDVLFDAIKKAEWGASRFNEYGETAQYCPVCDNEKSEGHKDDCEIGDALALYQLNNFITATT